MLVLHLWLEIAFSAAFAVGFFTALTFLVTATFMPEFKHVCAMGWPNVIRYLRERGHLSSWGPHLGWQHFQQVRF
jgi:hypothetical protein